MPNIQSNKKNLRKTVKRTAENRAVLSRMRTQSKKIINMIGENNTSRIDQELGLFYQYADKAVKKGVVKKNNAARKKSEITKKITAFREKAVDINQGVDHAV